VGLSTTEAQLPPAILKPRQLDQGSRGHHPVVHCGLRRCPGPTPLEWDSRSQPTAGGSGLPVRGLERASSLGTEAPPRRRMLAQTWQGEFPHQEHRPGRLRAHLSVGVISPRQRLWACSTASQMVWEWTDDWYQQTRRRPRAATPPEGGQAGCCHDPHIPAVRSREASNRFTSSTCRPAPQGW